MRGWKFRRLLVCGEEGLEQSCQRTRLSLANRHRRLRPVADLAPALVGHLTHPADHLHPHQRRPYAAVVRAFEDACAAQQERDRSVKINLSSLNARTFCPFTHQRP